MHDIGCTRAKGIEQCRIIFIQDVSCTYEENEKICTKYTTQLKTDLTVVLPQNALSVDTSVSLGFTRPLQERCLVQSSAGSFMER